MSTSMNLKSRLAALEDEPARLSGADLLAAKWAALARQYPEIGENCARRKAERERQAAEKEHL